MKLLRALAKLVLGSLGFTLGVVGALVWGIQHEYSVTLIVMSALIFGLLCAVGAVQILFPRGTANYHMKNGANGANGAVGPIALKNLCESLLVFRDGEPASFQIDIVRQSGSVQRVISSGNSEDAKRTVMSTFNRKQVNDVRIWRNDDQTADVRINYYHGRGRSEGRVIAGVVVRRA